MPQLKSAPLYPFCGRKIVMGKGRGLLGKVVGRLEISAEEPYFTVYIALQQHLALAVGKLAVDGDRSCAGDSRNLTFLLAPLLEAAHLATEDNQVGEIGGVTVTVTINMPGALFLELLNQVLVERHLEFGGQLDLVGLNHFYPDR